MTAMKSVQNLVPALYYRRHYFNSTKIEEDEIRLTGIVVSLAAAC